MPCFKCSECGGVENTALSNYAWDHMRNKKPALCSECDPSIGEWHGEFEKMNADEKGFITCADGFLYQPSELEEGGYAHHRRAYLTGDAK